MSRYLLRKDGVRGFFRGLGPPLASVSLFQAVAFASFSSALPLVTDAEEDKADALSLLAAGTLSGIATTVVTTPTDLVKIRLQLQTSSYGGMIDCGRQILRREGVVALFRGFGGTRRAPRVILRRRTTN